MNQGLTLSDTEKSIASWMWLLCFFTGLFALIPAMFGRLAQVNGFTYTNATHALNFWLTELVFSIVLSILSIIAYAQEWVEQESIVLVRVSLMVLFFIWHSYHCIKGAITAHRGHVYRPIFSYQFIK